MSVHRSVFGRFFIGFWSVCFDNNFLGGIKKMSEDNRRVIKKMVNLSENEYNMLKKLSDEAGRNMSDYMRYVAIIKPYRTLFGGDDIG